MSIAIAHDVPAWLGDLLQEATGLRALQACAPPLPSCMR